MKIEPWCIALSWRDAARADEPSSLGDLARRYTSAETGRDEWKGQKTADHAPVVAVFED